MPLRLPIALVLLAAGLLAPGPRAGEAGADLPPEDLAVRIRRARIAGQEGDISLQRRLLEGIAREHPEESSALVALMDLYLALPSGSAEAGATREVLGRLLLAPGRTAPLAVLQSFALDESATQDDLEMVIGVLEARAARGAPEPEALLLLAGLQERAGRLVQARETMGRLLELRGDPEVRQRCLYMDIELERWDGALDLLRAQRRVLGESRLRLAAALIYSALGRAEEVSKEVAALRSESLVFTRELIQPLIEVGFALHDGGFDTQARLWFGLLEERFEGDPSVRSASDGLFGAGTGRGDPAQGLPVDLLNEGTALLSAGDSHRAYPILERAAALMEDSDLAWFNLGLAAADLQRWVEAEAAFDRAVGLAPRFLKARIQRAQARLRLGRVDEAAADAQAALEQDPAARDAVLILYHCARERGDEKEARRLLRRHDAMPPH